MKRRKRKREKLIVYTNRSNLKLVMISGVRLALSVIVGIVPRATGRPSSGRNWRGPSNIAAVPPIVGGDIGFFRPKCLQADERRNGK